MENKDMLEYSVDAKTEGSSPLWDQCAHMQIGHKKALAILEQLNRYADQSIQALSSAREELETSKRSAQKLYTTVTDSAQIYYSNDCTLITKECEQAVAAEKKRTGNVDHLVTASETLVRSLPEGTPYAAKRKSLEGMHLVQGLQKDFQVAVKQKITALETLRDCKIAQAEEKRDAACDVAKKEQLERDAQAEEKYSKRFADICAKQKQDAAAGELRSMLTDYAQAITTSAIDTKDYVPPVAVPEFIMLGEAEAHLASGSYDTNWIMDGIIAQIPELGRKQTSEYIVKIPYAQKLADGISLMMRYQPKDRTSVQDKLQPLLLKLFMQFPAGKLEATMIDPIKSGSSFSDIPKLADGSNEARIIDTKVWCNERDIESAISILNQELETRISSYGDNHSSRLKKESVRVLAIADFPAKFTDTALKDLTSIIRNSKALGVCVLICADEEELKRLSHRHSALLTEISQSLIECQVMNGHLHFMNTGKPPVRLYLDEMLDVLAQKDKIIPALRDRISKAPGLIEPFHTMYPFDIYDSNHWFTGDHDEISIPLGIKGASTIVNMVLGRGGGNPEHHALLVGQTGTGKSTLLHTLIMSTMISYSPDEVQMYLLDFKEGVEFTQYARYRLPSLRVVAINSEREFGLSVLQELCFEFELRSKHFRRHGAEDINGYLKLENVPPVPKLLLIFDEVQELFRDNADSSTITADALSCLKRLITEGRAMGIHLILACQDFRNCPGLATYFSQMAVRIAVKGTEEAATSVLSPSNTGYATLKKRSAGAAIYNNSAGDNSANNFFHVSYINKDEQQKLLSRLNAYYSDAAVAPLYADLKTRILLTNAQDDVYNCFNQLILRGATSLEPLGKKTDDYGLLLGQGFSRKDIFLPELCVEDRDNLLIVTNDQKIALSMFVLSTMSVLYETLHTTADKHNPFVYIVDLFEDELSTEDCDLQYLGQCFPDQVTVVNVAEIEALVCDLYDTLLARVEGRDSSTKRIFFMFFGIDIVQQMLQTDEMYDTADTETLTVLQKLQAIISKGAKYGITSIVWGESLSGIESMLGERYKAMFYKRIAYNLDKVAMDTLVAERNTGNLHGHTAVYKDIHRDIRNTHFRPYETPMKTWVEDYAEAYKKLL